MRTPDAIRAKRYRDRRRLGKVSVLVVVSEQDIELKGGHMRCRRQGIDRAVVSVVLEAA